MNDEELKDMLEAIYGIDKVPKEMTTIIASFKQRKSRFRPQPITASDIAMLSVVFDFMKSMTEELKVQADESAEALALKQLAEESESGE